MTFTISYDSAGAVNVSICPNPDTPVRVYIDGELVHCARTRQQPKTAEPEMPGKPNPFYGGLVRAKKKQR